MEARERKISPLKKQKVRDEAILWQFMMKLCPQERKAGEKIRWKELRSARQKNFLAYPRRFIEEYNRFFFKVSLLKSAAFLPLELRQVNLAFVKLQFSFLDVQDHSFVLFIVPDQVCSLLPLFLSFKPRVKRYNIISFGSHLWRTAATVVLYNVSEWGICRLKTFFRSYAQ